MMKWIGGPLQVAEPSGKKNALGAPWPRVVTPALSSHLSSPSLYSFGVGLLGNLRRKSFRQLAIHHPSVLIAQPPCVRRAKRDRKKKKKIESMEQYAR